MSVESLKCKECGERRTSSAPAYVCENGASARSRWPMTTRRWTRPRRSGGSRPARRESGATPTSCPSRAAPGDPLEPGLTPLLRADRLAERLGHGRRDVDQERRRQPDPLLQGPGRRGRRRQGPGARLRHRRLRLDRQPRQRGRRPRRRRRAATPTSSSPPTSRSRSCSRPASTGPTWSASAATTTTSTGSARSSPRAGPGPSSTSTCVPTTPRARRRSPTRRSSSSAGNCPTASSARSPPARSSPNSAAASRSGSTSAWSRASQPIFNGAQAEGCSPVATAFAEGWDVCKPQTPGHDRQEPGDRRPGRRALRGRARPSSTGGGIDSVTDAEIREAIKLLAETTGIFTETAGGVTIGVLRKLAERGELAARRTRRRLHHRRGPEDPRRDSRYVPDARDRPRPRQLRVPSSAEEVTV